MSKKTLTIELILLIIIIFGIYYTSNQPQITGNEIIDNKKILKPDLEIEILEIFFEKIEDNNSTKIYYNLKGWVPLSGKWKIENNELIQDQSGRVSIILNKELTDYTFQFKTKAVDLFDESVEWILRYNNNRGYLLQLHKFQFIRTYYWDENGNYYIVAGDSPQNVALNQWYTIKTEHRDNNLKVYIDGVLKKNESDSRYLTGKVGLGTSNTKAHFSNIMISEATNNTINLNITYQSNCTTFCKFTITPNLIEKRYTPSGSISSNSIYTFPTFSYTANNNTLDLSFPSDLIRPPDVIYFPTEPYNRTFAIRLIAKGWDEQNQEWVFKEFMSPEFTWEDVVEGMTIEADGSRQ